MSLRDKVEAELTALIGTQNQQLVAQEGQRTLRADVLKCEALAVSLDRLVLETAELAAADVAHLERAAQALSNRVNYLLEPISPIETDADSCTVQMRSNPPQKDDNGYRYYELLLRRGGSVMLDRFEKRPGGTRTRVPATLTHEVVCRLTEDFDQTVDDVLSFTKKP
jgi:hypothetical protein